MDNIPILQRANDELILTKKPAILTDPDTQKHMANMVQQQILQNVYQPPKTDYIIKNPHAKSEEL